MVPRTLLNLIDKNEYLKIVSDLYISNGFEFYLVGGAVRDGILDIDTKDFDFTTNATPEDSISLLNSNGYKTTEIGREFGTIELQIDDNSVHITTYRKDTYENSSRNPSIESAADLNTDLSRRDFTINSIAYSIDENELVDPFLGLKDLASGTIKTPDAPVPPRPASGFPARTARRSDRSDRGLQDAPMAAGWRDPECWRWAGCWSRIHGGASAQRKQAITP